MDQQKPPPTRRSLPGDNLTNALEPALKVGAGCGVAGFIFGGASGIIHGWPPGLSGSVSALQTFGLGSTYSFSRSLIIQAWTVEEKPPVGLDLVQASAIAGCISGGSIGFLARGRANVIPGALMFALFGGAGQFFLNTYRDSKAERELEAPKGDFWKRMSEKSWTPFRVLTNEEYAEMLKERMLKMDVEIAVLNDKIVALKEEQKKVPVSTTPKVGDT